MHDDMDDAMRKVSLVHQEVCKLKGRQGSTKCLLQLRVEFFWSASDHQKGHTIPGVRGSQTACFSNVFRVELFIVQ